MSVKTREAEELGRMLARWLAPYIAEELEGRGRRPRREHRLSGGYDQATCAVFVEALGEVVLKNGETFFSRLTDDSEITSLGLAEALGVRSPREIPSVLTTPIKRRAKALALPLPWDETARKDRTVWLDRDGIAARMLAAIRAERSKRGGNS